MSGDWAHIVGADGSDEWLQTCSAALAEVQRETLSRAAQKIRRELTNPDQRSYDAARWNRVVDLCADLIDPDKEE